MKEEKDLESIPEPWPSPVANRLDYSILQIFLNDKTVLMGFFTGAIVEYIIGQLGPTSEYEGFLILLLTFLAWLTITDIIKSAVNYLNLGSPMWTFILKTTFVAVSTALLLSTTQYGAALAQQHWQNNSFNAWEIIVMSLAFLFIFVGLYVFFAYDIVKDTQEFDIRKHPYYKIYYDGIYNKNA